VQVRDANGEVVTRTLRTYDTEGRVIEEKQILEPEMLFNSEDRAKMVEESGVSAEQLRQQLREGILKLLGGRSEFYSFSNRYDTRGRLSHGSILAARYQGEVEITYNEHGDRELEIGQGSHLNAESDPNNVAPSTSYSETRYSYKYDQHDNWIEKVESRRSSPDSPFQFSSPAVKRTLAYY
jgi:hypothetical protein